MGLSFQVQFVKLNYIAEQQNQQELGQELGQEQKVKTFFSLILKHLQIRPQSRNDLKEAFGLKKVSGYLNRTIIKLQNYNLIEQTIPENPNHPRQMFRITARGVNFIQLVEQRNI